MDYICACLWEVADIEIVGDKYYPVVYMLGWNLYQGLGDYPDGLVVPYLIFLECIVYA